MLMAKLKLSKSYLSMLEHVSYLFDFKQEFQIVQIRIL